MHLHCAAMQPACSSGELLRLFMSKPGDPGAWKVTKTDHSCFSSLHLMFAVLQLVCCSCPFLLSDADL